MAKHISTVWENALTPSFMKFGVFLLPLLLSLSFSRFLSLFLSTLSLSPSFLSPFTSLSLFLLSLSLFPLLLSLYLFFFLSSLFSLSLFLSTLSLSLTNDSPSFYLLLSFTFLSLFPLLLSLSFSRFLFSSTPSVSIISLSIYLSLLLFPFSLSFLSL